MDVIKFAREMRARGYRHTRRRRGEVIFGIRFPNRLGVSRVFDVELLGQAEIQPHALADLSLRQDALSAGFDLRAA